MQKIRIYYINIAINAIILHTIGMISTSTKKFSPLLKTVGLKATPDRMAILDTLSKSKKPLSVKDLKEKLAKIDVDQATIYRNMEILAKNNLIRPVNLRHGHNHYELIENKHHHHLICENCGKIVDVSKCDTSKIENQIKKLGNFAKINTHALEFFGTCKTCSNKIS